MLLYLRRYYMIAGIINYVVNLKYVDNAYYIMPKWKQDETKFTVSVNYHESRGYQSSIPKPIIDHLNNPSKITFVIDKKNNVKIIPVLENESSFIENTLEQSLKPTTRRGNK